MAEAVKEYDTALFRGRGSIPDLFAMVTLSEKFGWTYDQILEQPSWYIDAIWEKMRLDAEHQERRNKKT